MKYIFIIIGLFTLISCGSQYKQKLFYKNMSCVKQDKLTVSERNKIYPYNISAKVVLATYLPKEKGVSVMGSEMQDYFRSLKEDRNLFDKKRFKEFIYLNDNQKNELTDIIFNYGYKKNLNIGMHSLCYMPNNAILFLDKDDNLLEFIEICFDCNEFRTSNEEITLGDKCMQKMNLLDDFFLKSGIKETKVLR
ncbi:hypothetical protein [Faecalibacter rhinopitheci]|uniref:Uncharacterized protein n=1 Tax=Faecalibacter rhinopitheci TaxID=2779678 RepID=A0A8J7KDR2_9FLAO|nr:hypothetical protein [Faecalibacter rhinopitheci]MBF0597631.1 hypothetical protein [Faecalibacter rhinopitheci]